MPRVGSPGCPALSWTTTSARPAAAVGASDVGRSYVTQPDGSVESVRTKRLLPDFQPEPRPGSVVFVTERDAQDKTDPIARLAVIAQIVGSLVAIVAITKR